jgi:hypothetical protein
MGETSVTVENRRFGNGTWKWVLALGALCLSAGVYVGTLTPPESYELSIYAGPPLAFWGLTLSAAAAAVVLSIYGGSATSRLAGFGLSTSVVLTIGMLPLLRSYEFFGRFDALNHLGTVRDMLAGVSANTTIYPATHLLVATVVRLTGLSPEVALMMVTPIFLLVFSLGFYSIATHWSASPLGKAVSGLIPLAIPFVISVRLPKLQPLPTVAALLLFPLLLYLLFNSLHGHRRFTACFLTVSAAHVLYHPQHALILVLGIFVGNVLIRFSRNRDRLMKPSYSLPTFIGALLTAWLYSKPQFWGAFINIISGVQSDTGVVEGAVPTDTSLSAVGGSLAEVGFKVFVSKGMLVMALFAMFLYIFVRANRDRLPSNKEMYALAFLISSAPFVPLFAVGVARSQMFRYIGVAMIFTGIFFLTYISEREITRLRPGVRHMVAILLLAAAVTAMPIAYKSPYVYQPSEHVTQGELDGYRFVFENQHERPLQAIDTDPDRYRNALYGGSPPPQAEEAEGGDDVPIGANITARNVEEANGTIIVTDYARTKYLQLYPELGYTEEDFAYLESGPLIHKLYSNGRTNVYSSDRTTDRNATGSVADDLS